MSVDATRPVAFDVPIHPTSKLSSLSMSVPVERLRLGMATTSRGLSGAGWRPSSTGSWRGGGRKQAAIHYTDVVVIGEYLYLFHVFPRVLCNTQ